MYYKKKYLKYKSKYLYLKKNIDNILGSGNVITTGSKINPEINNEQSKSKTISTEQNFNQPNSTEPIDFDFINLNFEEYAEQDMVPKKIHIKSSGLDNKSAQINQTTQTTQTTQPVQNELETKLAIPEKSKFKLGFDNFLDKKIYFETDLNCPIQYNLDHTYKTKYPGFDDVILCHLDWLSNLLNTKFTYKRILFKSSKVKRGTLKYGYVFTKKEQEDFIKTILFLQNIYNRNNLLNRIKLIINESSFVPSINLSLELKNLDLNILYNIIVSQYNNIMIFIEQTKKLLDV